MKRITTLAFAILASSVAFSQKWVVDKNHSKVGFTVTHMMLSDVDGNFKKFDATITSTKDDFSDAVIDLTADVNSVDTDSDMRDNHIKGADFFDTAKYPNLSFHSTSITKVNDRNFKLIGNLTMHGVTKPVTLDLKLNGVGKDMRTQKPVAGFKATGNVKRTDFGVGNIPDAVVSDNIEISASGEFSKQ